MNYYTKYCSQCHLLFGITLCYNYLLQYIGCFFTNKGLIGCLDNVEHSHLYLVKNFVNNRKI